MKRILILVGAVVVGVALIVFGWWFISEKTTTQPSEQKQWSDFY